ncbi:MAG TPA: tetratricopeptide repeat protein [Bryobacteraceae bacterium]|nr:tetratricopeptide repeat protein [Bryobacteraceae bacterium]
MFRSFCGGFPLFVVLAATAAHAQDDPDEAWKNLVLQGTYYAVDKHDYPRAEEVFQKALHEASRFGPSDVRVGATLNKLGLLYHDAKKLGEAESAFRRALPILDDVYGVESIDAANINYNLASVLIDQGKQPAALPFLHESLTTYERQFGPNSLKTASVLCMIGDSYRAQRAWQQAEQPLKRCAEIREADGGVVNAELGDALNSLALVYHREGKYALADPMFKLAERIRERTLGITNPALAETLEAHATLLKELGRDQEAGRDAKLAAAIRRVESKGK